jgi:hypothetical protein
MERQEMAARPFGRDSGQMAQARLGSIRGWYQVQFTVSRELIPILGTYRFNRALGTQDESEARERMAPLVREVTEKFDRLLIEVRKKGNQRVITLEDLDKLEVDIEKLNEPFSKSINDAINDIFVIGSDSSLGLSEIDARLVVERVDRLIHEFNIPITKFSRSYWRLSRAIISLQREAISTATKTDEAALVIQDQLRNRVHRIKLGKATLTDVIGAYRNEFSERWTGHRRGIYTNNFKVMMGLLGAQTPIRQITRQNFIEARDVLDNLSTEHFRHPDLKQLSIRDASAKSKELGLVPICLQTVNNYVKIFHSLMTYAFDAGYIDRIPSRNTKRVRRFDDIHHVTPFGSEQLNAIFRVSPTFESGTANDRRGARFWIPLLSLWSGLRITECAQLYVEDITEVEGVWVIKVESISTTDTTKNKFLKTRWSRRVVPIHPILIKLGLLEHAARMRDAEEIKLFSDANREFGKHMLLTKQIQYDIRKAGISGKNQSARCFRHNFRDALRNARVPEDVVRILGGWTHRTTADGYGGGPSMKVRSEYLAEIAYPGLDLSHLLTA